MKLRPRNLTSLSLGVRIREQPAEHIVINDLREPPPFKASFRGVRIDASEQPTPKEE